jgi:hypothetical protein
VRDRVGVEVLNAAGVEGGGASDHTMYLVALRKKELGQIRAILKDKIFLIYLMPFYFLYSFYFNFINPFVG